MNRRALLSALAAASSTLVSRPVLAALNAEFSDGPVASGQPLTERELVQIGQLADIIIPNTDTPGALAAGVDVYIRNALSVFFTDSERRDYLSGLALFAAVGFWQMGPDQQQILLAEIDSVAFDPQASGFDARLLSFYRDQKALTLAGYYTSQIGQTLELQLPPMGEFIPDLPLSKVGRAWA